MNCKLSQVVFGLGGIVLIVCAALMFVAPSATCRGVELKPGDVCHYASPTSASTDRIQTYEQRIASVRANAPIVAGLGVSVLAFSVALMVSARKSTTHCDSGIGPYTQRSSS